MHAPLWLSLFFLGVICGLGVWLATWLICGEVRERRRERATAQLTRYRRGLSAASPSRSTATDPPSQKITVNHLIARIQTEGQPVRLNWDDDSQHWPADEDWPTGVLPRIIPDPHHEPRT
jgi:hypothetical protein